jgi:hypothetical protein
MYGELLLSSLHPRMFCFGFLASMEGSRESESSSGRRGALVQSKDLTGQSSH